MSWPAVKQGFQQEQFREYVASLSFGAWRPSLIVWHNTALPTLAQWHATAADDVRRGVLPGTTRIANLERYFRDDRGWSGAPHLFVADDLIWVFNLLTAPGTHSPSWNPISIGIEMVGDFDREDDDSGHGLKVKRNCIFVTAILCTTFGLMPRTSIRLHREDPRTTHACPGFDVANDKSSMIAEVEALMAGGEHSSSDIAAALGTSPAPAPPQERRGVVMTDGLNFRRGPGVTHEATGSLNSGVAVTIVDEAKNGGTSRWLRVRTPAGYVGWISGRYVNIEGE